MNNLKKKLNSERQFFMQGLSINLPVIAGVSTSFTIVSVFLSFIENRECNIRAHIAVAVACLLVCFICIITTYLRILKKDKIVFPIKNHRHHKVIVLKNDFVENFKKLLADEKPMPLVVLGIDTTLDLEKSTTSGITRAINDYLKNNCNCTLQEKIDGAYEARKSKERKDGKRAIKLGGSLLVENISLPVNDNLSTGSKESSKQVSFLFFADSKTDNRKEYDEKNKEFADYQHAISSIFNELRKGKDSIPQSVLIGAMGTNAGGASYSVVMSTILNSYRLSVKDNKPPKELFLSIRLTDIERHDFNQKEVIVIINDMIKHMAFD